MAQFQGSEDELAYIFQQEQHRELQQPLAEQHQYCTPSLPLPPAELNAFSCPSQPPYSSSLPRLGVPALPSLSSGLAPEQGQAQQSSTSIISFSGQQASKLTFSGGALPEAIEGVPQAPERRSRAQWNTREHVMAERRRREKMHQQFVALASIVPDLTKTDKTTLLESTIKYVKQLEERVKNLESRHTRRTYVPTAFESKCSISSDQGTSATQRSASGAGVGSGSSPSIEASVHGDTILLKICCKESKGVLVAIISELENQGKSIINTNVLPFADTCLSITITAKTGEGCLKPDGLVTSLTTVLRSFT